MIYEAEDRISIKLKELHLNPLDIKFYRTQDLGQHRPKYISIWLTSTTDFSNVDLSVNYTSDEEELFNKELKVLDEYFKIKETSNLNL